eukprot:SM000040S14791  [mRNA]  locus=s40:381868:383280:+ [translate_table: standard]
MIGKIPEPAAVAFSLLNLAAHLHGLAAFLHLVYRRLPRQPAGDGGPIYEYAGLWAVFGVLAANSWLWSAIFHTRDTKFTEAWDYSSVIALLGFSLVLSIFRAAALRLEAARVMVSAPIVAFVATHILYMNLYSFDYGWNMKVCLAMGVLQLALWSTWAGLTQHPARATVWATAAGTLLAGLLEVFDFPPLGGVLDAHALWHAATVPLTLLWWRFAAEDALFRTTTLVARSTTARALAHKAGKDH